MSCTNTTNTTNLQNFCVQKIKKSPEIYDFREHIQQFVSQDVNNETNQIITQHNIVQMQAK